MSAELASIIGELVGAGTGMASLATSYMSLQLSRGRDFLNRTKAVAGIETDEMLVSRVQTSADREIVFTSALEQSLSADWEQQRESLARIAAETLTSEEWSLDEISLLLRTTAHLGRNDLTVLLALSTPRPERYEDSTFAGAASEADLTDELGPNVADLLPPVLGALQTAGLIHDVALGSWSYGGPRWLPTPYAFRFLRLVGPADHFKDPVLTIWLRPPGFHIRNLGPGDVVVQDVAAETDVAGVVKGAGLPLPLPAGAHITVASDRSFAQNAEAWLKATWTTAEAESHITERHQRPRR